MKRKHLKDSQESGFKVPKDYFEDFEKTIMSHAILKDKLNHSGFSVPEGYFDNVEEKILTQISDEKPSKVIALFNKRSLIYVTSIAATLVLLFSIIQPNTNTIDTIETASIESYLSYEDFETEELVALIDDTAFIDEAITTLNFSENDIENYVIENLEINDLYIE